MGTLFIFNIILIATVAAGLWLSARRARSARAQGILLAAAAVLTVLLHYSTFLIRLLSGDAPMQYLRHNPNLLLPIYPCNVVMWSAVIFACIKNKRSAVGRFLADYLFWFGILSTLVGMFANVDFIRNPTLADYENVKSIASHATLLFNILLLPVFGFVRIDVRRNLRHMALAILLMGVLGGWCNLVFHAVGSEQLAHEVNSMFLLHSPFAGLDMLIYPVIALIALPLYFGVFLLCDLFAHRKGERFFDRVLFGQRRKNG